MNIRKHLEEIEKKTLREEAQLAINSKGRKRKEAPCPFRTCYQKDRDKILYSKAFRRLAHKTQVFIYPEGDHYRTRFTHTLEVAQIARSIAKSLEINETLAEAVALGHDLGHTPFGHIGEEILNKIHKGGFNHVEHSIRIVEFLENNGKGLNLTYEVIDGIKKHSKGRGPIITNNPEFKAKTLEGQIVRIADIIAYLNHDIDDAIRAKILEYNKIPKELRKIFPKNSGDRINKMVSDVIKTSLSSEPLQILISKELEEALDQMRSFLFKEVYDNTKSNRSYEKIYNIISELYNFYIENPDKIKKDSTIDPDKYGIEKAVLYYIAGMTDRFAINTFKKLFIPDAWAVI